MKIEKDELPISKTIGHEVKGNMEVDLERALEICGKLFIFVYIDILM